jgi:NAD(P)-dependent dehydrogenase (short-subunit alcohol dehydrogenase family)
MRTVSTLMSLKGRTALVTGGMGYLGSCVVEVLAELGANVAIVDIASPDDDCISALMKKWSVNANFFKIDLANESEVRLLPVRVKDAFGALDILINCAAFVGSSSLSGWAVPFLQQSSQSWRAALEVNLTSVFNLVQASSLLLKEANNGVVINVASIYGVCGPDMRLYEGTNMGNPAAYAASKGGLLQLTRWLSTVLAPHIRVNAITPGGIFRQQPQAFVERYENKVPLKRMATEEDFKGAIAFLASDLSSYVTGQNLIIDGGFSVW